MMKLNEIVAEYMIFCEGNNGLTDDFVISEDDGQIIFNFDEGYSMTFDADTVVRIDQNGKGLFYATATDGVEYQFEAYTQAPLALVPLDSLKTA